MDSDGNSGVMVAQDFRSEVHCLVEKTGGIFGGLKSGILDDFCGFLKLLRLQFSCTERLSPRDPLPYRTFAACLLN